MSQVHYERDHYIDFLRGIATLNILLIHTAFWSGSEYVPATVQSICLIIDVPFFFFLSGMVSTHRPSIVKTFQSLLLTYKKYVFFLFFYFVVLIVFASLTGQWEGITIPNLYRYFFFGGHRTSLRGVYYSSWFLPVYFTVALFGAALLDFAQRATKEDKAQYQRILYQLLSISLWGVLYSWVFGKNFVLLPETTLFYMFFFLLGAVCRKARIRRLRVMAVLVLFDIGLMKWFGYYFGWDISSSMQSMKFPPNIVWMLYSCLMIIVALYARDKITVGPKNVFCKIGKISLWFYFSQGLSGSFLFYIAPHLTLPWPLKLTIMYICNLTICLPLVFIVRWMWDHFQRLMKYGKQMWDGITSF